MRLVRSLLIMVALAVAFATALPPKPALPETNSSLVPLQPRYSKNTVPKNGQDKKTPKRHVKIRKKTIDDLTEKELWALRLQRNRDKLINWTLMPACYAMCYHERKKTVIRDVTTVTLDEFCRDVRLDFIHLWSYNVKYCAARCRDRKNTWEMKAWFENHCGATLQRLGQYE